MERLIAFNQVGAIVDYCNTFQRLFDQVRNCEEISEFYGIYLFICGLEPEIREIFVDWHQYSCIKVENVISLALKIDSNGLQDSFSPFDSNSSFYNKDLEFDVNITLEELMKDNEFFRKGMIQERTDVKDSIEEYGNINSAYKVFDEMYEPIRDELEAQFSDIYTCETFLRKKSEQKVVIHEISEYQKDVTLIRTNDVIVEMNDSKNFVSKYFRNEIGELNLEMVMEVSHGEVLDIHSFRDIVCVGDFWGQKSLKEGVLGMEMVMESFAWKPGWINIKKEETGEISFDDWLSVETDGIKEERKDVKGDVCLEYGIVISMNMAVETNGVDQKEKGCVRTKRSLGDIYYDEDMTEWEEDLKVTINESDLILNVNQRNELLVSFAKGSLSVGISFLKGDIYQLDDKEVSMAEMEDSLLKKGASTRVPEEEYVVATEEAWMVDEGLCLGPFHGYSFMDHIKQRADKYESRKAWEWVSVKLCSFARQSLKIPHWVLLKNGEVMCGLDFSDKAPMHFIFLVPLQQTTEDAKIQTEPIPLLSRYWSIGRGCLWQKPHGKMWKISTPDFQALNQALKSFDFFQALTSIHCLRTNNLKGGSIVTCNNIVAISVINDIRGTESIKLEI